MDGNGYWIKIVLGKLKKMLVEGAFIPDEEVRYVFLEGTPIKSYGTEQVRNEDRALLYLLHTGIVRGERTPNEYRRQELERRREEGIGVWSDWEKVDEAYREYEWTTWLYGVDADRFERELEKFGLKDTGTVLVEAGKPTPPSPIEAKIGEFTAHEDGTVRYDDKLINSLKPQQRRFVHALITRKGSLLTRNQIKDVLWDADDENNFAARATTTEAKITKRIGSTASDINKLLYSRGNKNHIVGGGDTSYKFIA